MQMIHSCIYRLRLTVLTIYLALRRQSSYVLKGHSQLCDRADLDTTFASLKSVYLKRLPQPLSVGYI